MAAETSQPPVNFRGENGSLNREPGTGNREERAQGTTAQKHDGQSKNELDLPTLDASKPPL